MIDREKRLVIGHLRAIEHDMAEFERVLSRLAMSCTEAVISTRKLIIELEKGES